MKKILVVGASGKTGRNIVKQLLELGHSVHIIVRTTNNLSKDILKHQILISQKLVYLILMKRKWLILLVILMQLFHALVII